MIEKELLTAEEVAAKFRVDGATVRRWARNGFLPTVRLPHRPNGKASYRFRAQTINALLSEVSFG